MTGYELSRSWFDFAFEKKECKALHTALFLWIVELNNRLGWKLEFGLPTQDTMEGLSIGNKNTYYLALKDLNTWGFINIVKSSKNQYQSCIISICRSKSEPAQSTALDKALILHESQHSITSGNDSTISIVSSIAPIDKQLNQKTFNHEQINLEQKTVENFCSKFSTEQNDEEQLNSLKNIEESIKEEVHPSLQAQSPKNKNTLIGNGELQNLCREYHLKNEEKYTPAMYLDFLLYWTAIVQNGTIQEIGKELWKTQKTFQLSSRLSTWFNNQLNKKNNNGNRQNTTPVIPPREGRKFEWK